MNHKIALVLEFLSVCLAASAILSVVAFPFLVLFVLLGRHGCL